jgi:hypothetical protein
MSFGTAQSQDGKSYLFPGGDKSGLPPGVAAECGLTGNDLAALEVLEACANRTLFKGAATTYARIQRFVLLGKLCHKLSEDDARTILANSRSELEEARSTLSDEDKDWAKTWQEAIVIGATQAASVSEAASEKECHRFAQPGGPLTKIMSWSGKPQSVDGVLVSPRSTP